MFPCRSLLVLLAAVAITAPEARAQAPRPPQPSEADNLFRSLDANGDGRLTLDEARPDNRTMLQQVLQMAGKGAGEGLTRAEFQAVFDRVRGGGGTGQAPPGAASPATPPRTAEPPADGAELPMFLRRVDGNGDGKLSRAEWGRISQLFNQLDANKDGQIDVEELHAPPSVSGTPVRTSGAANASSSAVGRNTGRGAAGGITASVWRGWVVDGRGENPDRGQMELELTIVGDQIRGREMGTQRAPGGLGAGNFTIDGDGRSGHLDATATEGPNAGRHYLGIYQLEGDVLRWCVSGRDRQRPDTMATERGNYLLILRRQGS